MARRDRCSECFRLRAVCPTCQENIQRHLATKYRVADAKRKDKFVKANDQRFSK